MVLFKTTPPRSTPKGVLLEVFLLVLFSTKDIVSVSGNFIITGSAPGASKLAGLLEKTGVKLFSPAISPLVDLYSTT